MKTREQLVEAGVGVTLVLVTLAAFWGVGGCEWITLDDPEYVTENPALREGITPGALWWAFTTFHAANWHPLTWLSHGLDVELFGLAPGPPHWESLGLHAANAVLLYTFLRRATGARWRSALVAALFAVHPLRVESVAWVAERKDVLAGTFWILALLAYLRFVRRHRGRDYVLALCVFALGLLAKPMGVTLPFVLLLLDVWPLGRTGLWRAAAAEPAGALLREKLPFLGLAVLSCAVTLAAQSAGGALRGFSDHTLASRAGTAVVAYASYLGALVWPADLAIFYPHPLGWPAWRVLGSAALLAALTGVCATQLRRRPYLAVGWLWYLVGLVPVIGLVQIGEQWVADRYTYLPSIGLLLAASWALADLAGKRPAARTALAVASAAAVAACAVGTRLQVTHWQSSARLFERALAVTDENFLAHAELGTVRELEGRRDEALAHYREALRIVPGDGITQYNLGRLLLDRNAVDAALPHLRASLRIRPQHPRTLFLLGLAMERKGDLDAAIEHYERGLRLEPTETFALGRLGGVLRRTGRSGAALEALRRALEIEPEDRTARRELAWLRATAPEPGVRAPAEALRLAEGLNRDGARREPLDVYLLALALAAAGRLDEAATTAAEAARWAEVEGQRDLAEVARSLALERGRR